MLIENETLTGLQKKMENRQFYCFGTGIQGQRWAQIIEDWTCEKNLLGYIDNSSEKQGTFVVGNKKEYQIYGLDNILDIIDTTVFIVITSIYYKEIIEQLSHDKRLTKIEWIAIDIVADVQLEISDFSQIKKEYGNIQIPKIIHYAWFGGEMPDKIKHNVDNWQKICPDYIIKQWNNSNYDVTKNKYMYQAYCNKAWSFVSDYTRLDVIWNEGGIYLDTDIELLKKPDELLYQKGFCCNDGSLVMNLGSGFGAVPHNKVVKLLMDYYENIQFIKEDGSIDNTSCNTHSYKVLRKLGYCVNDTKQTIKDMTFYPMILQGKNQHTGKERKTDKTFWIHHGNMSWFDK